MPSSTSLPVFSPRARARPAPVPAAAVTRRGGLDPYLLLPTVLLLCLGLVMVFSATYPLTQSFAYPDSFRFVKRQALSAAVGLLALLLASRFRVRLLRHHAERIYALALLLLVLVLAAGREVNSSRAYLQLGPLNFQPSELAKLALVIMLAKYLATHARSVPRLPGVLRALGLALPALLLVVLQPDFGTAAITLLIALGLCQVAGARARHLALVLLACLLLLGLLLLASPEVRERFQAFLNPEANPEGGGYQTLRSLIAIGSGGPLGLGLGESREKFHYLPAAHTDYIFSILGQELGLLGTWLTLFLFACIAWRGFQLARAHSDPFHSLLASGLTLLITLQALVNIAVVTRCMPPTGLPLPFLSYGGSNLVISLTTIGLLLNLSRRLPEARPSPVRA